MEGKENVPHPTEEPPSQPAEGGERPERGASVENRNPSLPQPHEPQSGAMPPLDDKWDCTICMDQVREPVLSLCGHLFCWPCIYRWLELHHDCPVCKSELTREKLVPLYGRGEEKRGESEDVIPQRPAGHVTQQTQQAERERRPPRMGGGFPEFYFQASGGFGGPMVQFGMPGPYGAAATANLSPEQRATQARIAKWMFVLGMALLLFIMFGT